MDETVVTVTDEYFLRKGSQPRRRISDVSGKAFEAVEVATQVLRLCYPMRYVKAVHCYYNNEPIEPFLAQEHFTPRLHRDLEHVVVDVYFLFGGNYESTSEDEAFAVEVIMPVNAERARWNVARVRWADLGWNTYGNYEGDNPAPQLVGETIANFWS